MNFTQRTSKPKAGNKNYIRTSSGGWNTCVKGKPTDKDCDVLANCVGYASGRFNEIYNEITGNQGCKFKKLNCNAEKFIERAKDTGLEIGKTPRPGSILVLQKGKTLSGDDGAGHVLIVERIIDANPDNWEIYCSESGYNSKAFWNSKRNNKNGRWGSGSKYSFRGFIYNPVVIIPELEKPVKRDIYKNQIKALKTLNVREDIETSSNSIGVINKGDIFNWYAEKQGKSSIWYAINEEKTQWIAGVNNNGEEYCEIYHAEEPKPVEPKPTPVKPKPAAALKVGDKVKIIGTGNGSSKGTANTAYGIGWTRKILKIYEGRPYPYRVGDSKGTTGYYKADALKKK